VRELPVVGSPVRELPLLPGTFCVWNTAQLYARTHTEDDRTKMQSYVRSFVRSLLRNDWGQLQALELALAVAEQRKIMVHIHLSKAHFRLWTSGVL